MVNSTLHTELLERGANITFTLAQATSGGPTTTITLPYSAFDLTALPPYQGLSNSTTYFPLRRAQNDTQYTLGRTFMQEAYVTVDYERSKFNVSQCTWVQNAESNLVPIFPATSAENTQYSGAGSNATDSGTSSRSSSALSGGAIGGIVAGAVVGVAAVAVIVYFCCKRKYRARAAVEGKGARSSSEGSTANTSQTALNEQGTRVFPKAELEGSNPKAPESSLQPPGTPNTELESPTLGGYGSHISNSTQTTSVVSPLSPGEFSEAGGAQVFEMPGDMPEVSQVDGRQITEKDMMRRREQAINGVDPHSSEETQAVSGAEQQNRRTVQPEEVVVRGVVQGRRRPSTDHSHNRFSFEDSDEERTLGTAT